MHHRNARAFLTVKPRNGRSPRSGNGTLVRVDLKLEAPFDEAGQARHDPLVGLFTADVDVAVE